LGPGGEEVKQELILSLSSDLDNFMQVKGGVGGPKGAEAYLYK